MGVEVTMMGVVDGRDALVWVLGGGAVAASSAECAGMAGVVG